LKAQQRFKYAVKTFLTTRGSGYKRLKRFRRVVVVLTRRTLAALTKPAPGRGAAAAAAAAAAAGRAWPGR